MDKYGKIFIALLLLVFLILSILIIAIPSEDAQLSIYSDDWNDLSDFRTDLEKAEYSVAHISSTPLYLRELEKPENTVFVIAGMEREYSFSEVNALADYLSAGGNAIIADDFGYGNSILENIRIRSGDMGPFGELEYGISYRFSNKQVVDVIYDRDPNFLLLKTETIPSYQVMMNTPCGLVLDEDESPYFSDFLEDVEVLAQSSSMSWMDLNGNFSREPGEAAGPFPMVIKMNLFVGIDFLRMDRGTVNTLILLADPSIFINEMWNQGDNREFAFSMIRNTLPEGGTVIFDESLHNNENSATIVKNSYYFIFGYLFGNLGGVVLIEILLFSVLMYLFYKRKSKFRFHRHKDALDTKLLYMMLKPEMDDDDYHWVRWIMLDKVRITYDIPYEIFYSLSPRKQAELIGDMEIAEFLFGDGSMVKRPDSNYMKVDEWIIDKIIAWRPRRRG
jgi:hypothetical protein